MKRGHVIAAQAGAGSAQRPQSTKPASASAATSRRFTGLAKRPFLVGLLLALITVALYAPVHNHPFVNYDDDVYVTVNDHVKAGLSWQTVGWALTTYDAANWHPLTWLSHAADYQLFGDNPAGHHDDNLLLHAINVLLLFWVLFRATGYVGRSGMVAALFALHPINAETVVWIAERKNLLSMTFFLLALGAYRGYASATEAEKPRHGHAANPRSQRVGRYLVVAFFFALALMAKPQVVTFPFALLLWDYWPLQRMFAGGREFSRRPSVLLLEKIPFLLMSAISALLTVQAQRAGGGFNRDYTFAVRCENAVVSYVRYLAKAFWPSPLAPMYPHPGASLPAWETWLAVLILAGISALVLWARQRRYLAVGWLWFLGTLVPMIGVVQVGRQAMADRYAYLPFIGLFIMVSWGIADLADGRHISPTWIAVPACAALLVLATVTHRQIGYWSDNVTLWAHTAKVTSGNYEAEDNLGEALQKSGRADEAMAHFRRAAQIDPSYPPTLMFLAVYDQREGKLREAIDKYKQVISRTDNAVHQNAAMRAMAFGNMGHAYRELGERAAARSSLQSAVELSGDRFEVWMELGIVSQQTGDPAQAAHAFHEAMQLQPSDVGYLLLARALEESGHEAESQQALQKAKLLTNNYERAQQAAASLLAH